MCSSSAASSPNCKTPRLARETAVYAIHGPEASSELAMIDNLTALLSAAPPIHCHLLGNTSAAQVLLSEDVTGMSDESLHAIVEESVQRYSLNDDQATVLRSLASWCAPNHASEHPCASLTISPTRFRPSCTDPVRLVHGVFGAGKSHLLVVIILCLSRLFDSCGVPLRIVVGTAALSFSMCDPSPLIRVQAAGTNVAVDRVLLGLLKENYTDFLRVGSLKCVLLCCCVVCVPPVCACLSVHRKENRKAHISDDVRYE